jgi:hypothetical protein
MVRLRTLSRRFFSHCGDVMHDAPFENLDRVLHLVALGLGPGVELVGRLDLSLVACEELRMC